MIACQRDFTITVNAEPSTKLAAYWTLDELVGDFVDKVGSFVLTRGTLNSGPGLIANGAVFPGESLGPSAYGTAFDSATSKGVATWAWFRVNWTSGALSGYIILDLYPSDFSFGMDMSFQFNTPNFDFSWLTVGTGPNIVVSVPFVNNGWFFAVDSWDRDAGTNNLYINGVLVSSVVASGFSPSNLPMGYYLSIFDNSGTGGIQVTMDEIGYCLNHALSQAQVTALYNGGAGVTWPGVKTIVPL